MTTTQRQDGGVIKPVLQDEAFLTDLHAASADQQYWHLWWLGQSGFLIHWQKHWLLLDPYLSDSLTKKYAKTDKPHVRMTERMILPERLAPVHVVTSSHNHTDHFDAETLAPLMRVNPEVEILVPEANREFAAQRLGVPPDRLHGIDAGQSLRLGGFEFHAMPAAHETLELDRLGRHIYLGYVVQFGQWTIYHSGDTVRFDGMAELLRPFKVDVALLPINGRGMERHVAGNLWGREAAQLAKDISAQLAIPCHFEMFEFNTASPEEFIAECTELGQPFKVVRSGERWSNREW